MPDRDIARGTRFDLDRFYALLDRLRDRQGGYRHLRDCTARTGRPARGVYFFFEPGEYRAGGEQLRVVRVGTHAVSRPSRAIRRRRAGPGMTARTRSSGSPGSGTPITPAKRTIPRSPDTLEALVKGKRSTHD